MAKFNNWIRPTKDEIALEYKIEYQLKNLKALTNNAFPTVADFEAAVTAAKILLVTKSIDSKIAYRSHTRNQQDLLSLIKSYASYPQYRNEKTLDNLYHRFENNLKMNFPMVLKFSSGRMRVMSGNTRLDVAQHLDITPKALLIEVQ